MAGAGILRKLLGKKAGSTVPRKELTEVKSSLKKDLDTAKKLRREQGGSGPAKAVRNIKLDIKSILIVGGFLISGVMSYSNLKQEIELAKELPQQIQMDDTKVFNQKIDYLQKEIEKLEDQVDNLEDKVYKR